MDIRSWVEKFNAGEFESKSIDVQIDAGWFDWFCNHKSLAGKTKVLGPKVKKLAKSPKISVDGMHLLFKNNCPLYGNLYDDIRFCDNNTLDVIYTVIPKDGHSISHNMSLVWGRENGFTEPLYSGDWKGLLKWFGV